MGRRLTPWRAHVDNVRELYERVERLQRERDAALHQVEQQRQVAAAFAESAKRAWTLSTWPTRSRSPRSRDGTA